MYGYKVDARGTSRKPCKHRFLTRFTAGRDLPDFMQRVPVDDCLRCVYKIILRDDKYNFVDETLFFEEFQRMNDHWLAAEQLELLGELAFETASTSGSKDNGDIPRRFQIITMASP